jgi:RNA methyltransferase, TrmH family
MMHISKNTIKFIASLQQKKYRDENQLFVVEGDKIVKELLQSDFVVEKLVATDEWLNDNHRISIKAEIETSIATSDELKKMSSFTTPNQVLAIVKYKQSKLEVQKFTNKLSIALDNIQDPGNLGTIVRLADWFGVENIVCSEKSVEIYNPKVIQSTMGAFLRVNVFYSSLPEFIDAAKNFKIPVYGAFLEGEDIYSTGLNASGIIVMGNESRGISHEIEKMVDRKLAIPSFSNKPSKTESLNVAVATAIICSEFRRKQSIIAH